MDKEGVIEREKKKREREIKLTQLQKWNEILPYGTTWMDKCIKLSEIKQRMTNTVLFHLHLKHEIN